MRLVKRGLKLERLLNRQLLAFADFHFNLFEDDKGVVGQALQADQIEVGSNFFVEITGVEHDGLANGLSDVSVNIFWDPAILAVVEERFQLPKVITDRLPLFQSGQLLQDQGKIIDLRGSSWGGIGVGLPIGNGTAERFALIPFRALAESDFSSLQMYQGPSQISTEHALSLSDQQLFFEPQAYRVTEPLSPDSPSQSDPSLIVPTQTQVVPTQATSRQHVPKVELELSGDSDDRLVFGTRDSEGNLQSAFVRPADPDRSQTITIRNHGSTTLRIERIEVQHPRVHVAKPVGTLTIPPNSAHSLSVTYAPSGSQPSRWRPESLSLAEGIIIHTNAPDQPTLRVGLQGETTFDADVNYDGRVDRDDILLLSDHFGKGNNSRFVDPNGDGQLDYGDWGLLNAQYGKTRLVLAELPPAIIPIIGPVDANRGIHTREDELEETIDLIARTR